MFEQHKYLMMCLVNASIIVYIALPQPITDQYVMRYGFCNSANSATTQIRFRQFINK